MHECIYNFFLISLVDTLRGGAIDDGLFGDAFARPYDDVRAGVAAGDFDTFA